MSSRRRPDFLGDSPKDFRTLDDWQAGPGQPVAGNSTVTVAVTPVTSLVDQ
jgi:hypothetical protein